MTKIQAKVHPSTGTITPTTVMQTGMGVTAQPGNNPHPPPPITAGVSTTTTCPRAVPQLTGVQTAQGRCLEGAEMGSIFRTENIAARPSNCTKSQCQKLVACRQIRSIIITNIKLGDSTTLCRQLKTKKRKIIKKLSIQ